MTDRTHRNCEELALGVDLDRRSFLRSSVAGMLGLCLAQRHLLPAHAAGPESVPRPKSAILLWMDGGPSQMDTFNPKPGSTNGGAFKAIPTSVKGAQIGEHLPRLAKAMDQLTLIRSMTSKEGSHQRARYLGHTGYSPQPTIQYPSLGSIVSGEIGDEASPLPQYVSVNSPSFGGGYFGTEHSPFVVNNPLNKVENLAPPPNVDRDQFKRRLALLDRMERRFAEDRPLTEVKNHHATYAKSVRFMNAPEVSAFDLSSEPESVRNAYGMNEFGQGCLLARRLIETGVRFVEVTLRGWDTHQDNFTRTEELCGKLDPGFATLIDELQERDLWDSTMIVWMGEFGRTPKINPQEGRDHFTRGWNAALGGCGVPEGLVVGSTSADGTEVADRPTSTADLFATILSRLDIDPNAEFMTPAKRPITLVETGGKAIPEVLG